MTTLPPEVFILIKQFHNAFSQGPAAPLDVLSACLRYSGLQAIILSFSVDASADEEDVFWIIPVRHPLACCARFTCAPRLRHPQPARAQPALSALRGCLSDAPANESGTADYLGGTSRKPRAQIAGPLDQGKRVAPTSTPIPLDVLHRMPSYFLDYRYLRALALSSRSMLLAARSKEHWSGLEVHIDQPSLEMTRRLRAIVVLLAKATRICVSLRQLAMFPSPIPASVRLSWDIVPILPQPHLRNLLFGFRSRRPLMGCADFEVTLPANARGIYVGVREFRGQRRAYCRVDNLFHRNITWCIGINDNPIMPHLSASKHAPLPGATSAFCLRWDQRSFSIALNGVGVSRAVLRDGEHGDAAPPLSELFFMAFGQEVQEQEPARMCTLPSAVQLNANIRCGVCRREHSLLQARWSVCPACSTWVCSSHITQTPWANCPNCLLQLRDYLGGSSTASAFEGTCLETRRRKNVAC